MLFRTSRLSPPDCDDEGFPVNREPITPEPHRPPYDPQVDGESGECLQDKVVVLRRSVMHDPRELRAHLDSNPLPLILLQEQLCFRGLQLGNVELIESQLHCCLEFESDAIAELCQHLHHSNNTAQDNRGARTKRLFQIPPEYLQNKPSVEAEGNADCTISIWQEFLYGPPIMMLENKYLTKEELHDITDVSSSLSQFVHKNVVDVFLYLFFFGVFFVYCCIFNNILELALYISYGSHLCIHQLANTSNVDVTFSSSIFQGPAYVLIRMCCKHCIQKENAKVMRHLMHKMKRDILEAKVS